MSLFQLRLDNSFFAKLIFFSDFITQVGLTQISKRGGRVVAPLYWGLSFVAATLSSTERGAGGAR